MIEDCHRRFRDDEIVEELITLLETHVRIKEGSSESALGRCTYPVIGKRFAMFVFYCAFGDFTLY